MAAKLVKKQIGLGLALILSALSFFLLPDSCPEAARRVAALFAFVGCFWAFEVIALWATSLLIVVTLVFTLGTPDGVLKMTKKGHEIFFIPFSNPVILLFLGGFALARALSKHGVSHYLTEKILGQFKRTPTHILAGIMITTTLLSMWISNTASTLIMISIAGPLLVQFSPSDPFRKALILSIPFSANLGGIGTPIGTPPNAIALGNLNELQVAPSFATWMVMMVPLSFTLVAASYFILLKLYPPDTRDPLPMTAKKTALTKQGKGVLAIFLFTIALWLTSGFHGIPEAPIALLATLLLALFGLLTQEDINHLNWDVLILMWGGLALSTGMQLSGLIEWILTLPLFSASGTLLIASFACLGFFLSLFMSNTAASALLIPIAIKIPNESPLFLAITLALACSMAMIFPVSTPPNAIAFSKADIKVIDMIKSGVIISLLSLAVMLIGFRDVIGRFVN